MRRFLVIGLERFGRAAAEGLVEAGGEVIAVDLDLDRVEAVRDRVTVAAQIDAVEADALREIGAADVDAAIVVFPDDFAAEILAVAVLKEIGIAEIVALGGTERERRILRLVGATRVVSVEVESAQRLARALAAADVLDHVPLAEGVAAVSCTADERIVGKTLAGSGLADRYRLVLVALRAAGSERFDAPPPLDHAFREGDLLLLAGSEARLAAYLKGRKNDQR